MGKDLKGKELGKGISQRKDGRYQARFVNRFGKRETVYGDTLKDIRNNLASAKADDIKLNNVVSKNITLDEWYEKWMCVYKIPVVRNSTRVFYEYVYRTKISPILGKKRLTDITKLQVADLFNRLKEQGYAWETLNKTKLLLVDMFNKANEDDFVNKNVAKSVLLPVRRKKGVCNILSKEEQEAFLECSSGQFYHNLFLVALNTGLRPGELFALTEKDIDFDKGFITVNKTLLYEKFDGCSSKEFRTGDTKTESSVREVPINAICKNALIKQILQTRVVKSLHGTCRTRQDKLQAFPNLLFTTKFGTPINAEIFNEAIARIVNEVNLTRDSIEKIPKISGHSLRHTFATRCFEAGISPKTVQSYLGHSSIKMTMDLYTSVLDQKKQDDMKLLETSLGIKPQDLSLYSDNIIQFHAS